MTLLIIKIYTLRTANKILSKRRRIKNIRVQQKGILIIENGNDILTCKNAIKEIKTNQYILRKELNADSPNTKRCGFCKKTDYNARTCREAL